MVLLVKTVVFAVVAIVTKFLFMSCYKIDRFLKFILYGKNQFYPSVMRTPFG